jgi:L-fuconolactonase
MIQDIADPEWMLRTELEPAFEAMVDHGLVFDALVRTVHLPALRELVARYPDLKMVLDHGAKPPIAAGDLSHWKREIATLARETPLVCKLSGLVTEAGSADPAVLTECVDHLLAHFGPKRLMWGSDWPVCELVCTYETWRQASRKLLERLSAAERDSIHSGVARNTYGI